MSWIGAAGCALLALTGHFGMLLEGSLLWVGWLGGTYLLVPTPLGKESTCSPSSPRALLALALAGVYYLGYTELVTSQWQRALGGGGGEGGGLRRRSFASASGCCASSSGS